MMTTETKLLTAGDLLRLYSQGVRGELIPGVLCETMASGQEHGEIVMKLRRCGATDGSSDRRRPPPGARSSGSMPTRSGPATASRSRR